MAYPTPSGNLQPGSWLPYIQSPAQQTYPSSPSGFASYVNSHLTGSDGKKGSALTALDSQGATGTTIGAQWLSWYAASYAQHGSTITILEYEEAFLTLYAEAQTAGDLGAGVAGGLAAGGAMAQSAATTSTQLFSGLLNVLQSGSLWLRIGEGVLGIVLIAVGVAKLTGAVPVATKIARMV